MAYVLPKSEIKEKKYKKKIRVEIYVIRPT